MTGSRILGPTSLVVVGLLAIAFWVMAIVPALGSPLGYSAGTELRRILFGSVWPAFAGVMVITGGLRGIRRCRDARSGWGARIGLGAFGLAFAAGAAALVGALIVLDTQL